MFKHFFSLFKNYLVKMKYVLSPISSLIRFVNIDNKIFHKSYIFFLSLYSFFDLSILLYIYFTYYPSMLTYLLYILIIYPSISTIHSILIYSIISTTLLSLYIYYTYYSSLCIYRVVQKKVYDVI